MKILAIETSWKSLSIALNENSKTITSLYCNHENINSESIFEKIDFLLKNIQISIKDIDMFAVSSGPGSFTGIRIGITAAKTFSQSLNKPIIAIDSLSILKSSIPKQKGLKIFVAIDALRNEIYIKNNKEIIIKNINSFIKKIKKLKNKSLIVGNAAIIYKKFFIKDLGRNFIQLPQILHMPNAKILAFLAYKKKKLATNKYNDIKPLYIRRSYAEENKKTSKSNTFI
ncbi:MAG: tRNA (adenosine(37)-N6)-threonylcarbamoyltransferase complex dimerization subunit type 1 TsaB [Endomicrobium sp.]|jgi:tRNA threonylcarbamoyladenosine biosynthesis protein TsaB|nr:tRNA (adenosine(37)-N6)-threonylcarbamoyltransferase complex dimerization subunit type 1 TsaB [Endomicrobium sp.]